MSMPRAESIMGLMVSSVVLQVPLPPEEPVSMLLRSLQDTSTLMLKHEIFHSELASKKLDLRNHIRFNWFPLDSDFSSRVAEFTVGNDKASLSVMQELYPNPHSEVGWFINIYDNGDRLRVSFLSDDRLLDPSWVERTLDLFVAKLRKICGGQEIAWGV